MTLLSDSKHRKKGGKKEGKRKKGLAAFFPSPLPEISTE